MGEPNTKKFDVVIIGGGIAGSTAAWTLSRSGLTVALIDEREEAPRLFRAERISSLAVRDFRGFGLGELLDRVALPLPNTAVVKGDRVERITTEVDFSVPLWTFVNEIRSALKNDKRVEFISGKVEEVETSPIHQAVRLGDSGEWVEGRLLVVATGASMGFLNMLGVSREIISRNHSSTFGFDLDTSAEFSLPAASATVRICRDWADYMNIFPKKEGGFRANLFTYWPSGDARQREFIKSDSTAFIKKLTPRLMNLTGGFRVEGPVECGSVSVLKSKDFRKAGFVLIGDAYGRICPCAGRGINKVLSDIRTLKSVVPSWIRRDVEHTPKRLAEYYQDDDRTAFEEWVFRESITLRNRIVDSSPKQVLRRVLYHHLPPAVQDAYWACWGSKRKSRVGTSQPVTKSS